MAGIFSSYRQGENRITSSLLGAFQLLPTLVLESILAKIVQEDGAQFLFFQNQIKSAELASVPDARISANFSVTFETKIKPAAIDAKQTERHLSDFNRNKKGPSDYFVFLSPDQNCPEKLTSFLDANVLWLSFADLDDILYSVLGNEGLHLTERDRFLLAQLRIMFDQEGLLPIADRTVVVAARAAWPIYKKTGLYICQANRHFHTCSHMAFYCDGEIKGVIAKVVDMTSFAEVSANNKKEIDRILSSLPRGFHDAAREQLAKYDNFFKVIVLSPPEHAGTLKKDIPIQNDLKNENGRAFAYTQGQRYTTLGKLMTAKTTSDLLNTKN